MICRNDALRRAAIALVVLVMLVLGCVPTRALAEELAADAETGGETLEMTGDDGLLEAQAIGDRVADGVSGTCEWSIDKDGALVVKPAGGAAEGTLEREVPAPWLVKSWGITSARFEGIVHAQTCHGMFDECMKLQSVDLTGLDTSVVTDMSYLFYRCGSLTSIEGLGLDTSKVTDMSYVFFGCGSLPALDLTSWDTSKVTDMRDMFSGCVDLTSLDVSGWDTSKVTDMRSTFDNCDSLTTLDLSSWDTSSVTTMYSMFNACFELASLNVSGWDTSSVTNMGSMFKDCKVLPYVDVAGFDTSSVTNMYAMFRMCRALKSLDLSGWDMSSLEDASLMFYQCSKLASVNLSGWDTTNIKIDSMFTGCQSFEKITLSDKFDCERAFPTSVTTRWWSQKDKKWFTFTDIITTRNRVADTYIAHRTINMADVTVSKVTDHAYTGGARCPKPRVKIYNVNLREGTDFTFSYQNNVDPGTATIIIKGKGECSGEKRVTFKIVSSAWWSGATRIPVAATATYSTTSGAYIRLKSGGKWVTSDSVLSISGKTITGKKAGTTTLYLFNKSGRQVSYRTITVYALTGKWEFQSSVDKNYVLDIQLKSKNNGARMIVWKRNNGLNQRYQFEKMSDGTYLIKCCHSGRFVDVQYGGSKKGQAVIQWGRTAGTNQRWKISVDASNRVTFTCKKSGQCFDIKGGKITNQAEMIQWPANNGLNQKWVLNKK